MLRSNAGSEYNVEERWKRSVDYRPLWRADVFAPFEKNDLDRRADGNRGCCARGKKTGRSLMARNTRYGRKLPGVTVICAFFFSPPPSSPPYRHDQVV